MPFLETSKGVMIYSEEAGAGPPVVFIHGWSMSGRVWRFQRELSTSFRLITMDLRGHGQSAAPADGYAVEDFAADLVALFTHLGLSQAILVGWSMGVQVVLQAFPLLRPRLAGLVLVAGTPKFSANGDYPHGLPAIEVKGMELRLKRDYQKTMGEFFRGMFADGELDREQYQKIVHEIVLGGRTPEPEVARRSLQTLASADLRAVLPRIDLPVLLMHGGADAICLPAASRYMMEQMPNARLELFEGVGHAPFLSRPDVVNRLLKGFADGIYGRD